MTVKRIVCDIAVEQLDPVRAFYCDLLGLHPVMDQGWIVTLASGETAPVQISLATQGGSGAPVPDLSIEVDDVDAVYRLATEAGYEIDYDLTDEPWGVRRFFLRDPVGRLLNVLAHA